MAAHDDSTATILFALGANAVIALTWRCCVDKRVRLDGGRKPFTRLRIVATNVSLAWTQSFGAAGRCRVSAGPWPRDLLLVVHRCFDAVQHGRAVFNLRAGAQMGSDQPLNNPSITIAVLVLSIAAESVSAVEMSEPGQCAARGSVNVALVSRDSAQRAARGDRRRHCRNRSPERLALLAVGTAMLTGNPLYDALGSLAIGVFC